MLLNLKKSAILGGMALTLFASAASAQTMIIATDRVGTTFNAIGSGIAKVVTESSPARVIVRPFGGPDAFLGGFDNGELQLATLSSSSTFWAASGKNPSGKKYANMRIIRAGAGGVRLTLAVPKDSDIKRIADLKGRKVASDYGGHAVIPTSVSAALATGGLTWNDVKQVPVTGAVEGVRQIGEGRLDAAWAAFGMPIAREVHAKIGLRYLSFEATPDSLATLRKMIFPGAQLVTMKANPKVGLETDTNFISYESYLLAHKDVDDASIKAVLAALWDNTDTLTKIHRGLKGFTNDYAVSTLPVVAYHPAAIDFYKEKGVWTKEADMANANPMVK